MLIERIMALEIVGNKFGGKGLKILSYRDESSANIQCNRGKVDRKCCEARVQHESSQCFNNI